MVVDMPSVMFYGSSFQESYGSLKLACNAHGWTYNTIVKKKLPCVKDGWLINRVKFNPNSEK